MSAFIDFVIANKAILLGAALAVSEVLALIPSFKSSGILDSVVKFLQKLAAKE